MHPKDVYLRSMVDYLLEECESQKPVDQHSNRLQGLRYEVASADQFKLPPKPWTTKDLMSIWRGLINRREPFDISSDYLANEDALLKELRTEVSTVSLNDLSTDYKPLYLWQGDITHLSVDGIVNAANSEMLGCFIPNHHCIDNQIHTYAGVRMRLRLFEEMKEQGRKEPVGKARVTPGYNLPCEYVIHTVGPIITGEVNEIKKHQLQKCYRSCLKKADEIGLKSLAFCSISTGQFGYPKELAAQVAYETVCHYLKHTQSDLQVIFCVYSDEDQSIYQRLLEEQPYDSLE
ncbi:hypothetical protein CJ205_03450 [Dolosicoccus paucivorans]|uniref:Macro domain-containing protein n=1 Tax=Dolosicoccus paucivorans TaxID=84521 RepID=A0A2N6SNL1_9LACT|nr:protein-ADP-ribose hydrolase [Dolosicoccus paucivorans]PMB83735.1 hypothetical protein CJ206_07620 [Dolosicoccus paucivorans]PMC58649.1 hypothetical protein CJ205_03450 [Dolosicoccus paucivorans]